MNDPLATMAAALSGAYVSCSRAAYVAQWVGGTYHPRRGCSAVTRWGDTRITNSPYGATCVVAHYAWREADPVYGPGNGHLMVRPADRTEPRGADAWNLS